MPLITAESKDLFWRNYDALTIEASEVINDIVVDMVNSLQNQVTDMVQSGSINFSDLNITPDEYNTFVDAVSEACINVEQELLNQFGLGNQDLSGQVGQEIQNLTIESSDKIRDSIGVIKEEVQKTLVSNSSKTKDELLDILSNQFTSLKTSRARTIANTTAANVTSGMQHTVYKDLGFKMMWLTQRDSRVRPAHARLDGSMQDGKGKFTVETEVKDAEGNITTVIETTDRPLGRGLSASNAINCRCQLFPVEANAQEVVEKVEKPNIEPSVIKGGRGSQLKAINDFEKDFRNTRTHEMGALVDYDGNIIAIEKGSQFEVNSYINLSKEKINELVRNGNYIGTHNHPRLGSFSKEDILTTQVYNKAEFRAVDSKYNYVIQRPKDGWPIRNKTRDILKEQGLYQDESFQVVGQKLQKDLIKSFDKYNKDIREEIGMFKSKDIKDVPKDMHDLYELMINKNVKDQEVLWGEILHVINLRLAKKYKYDYQRVEVNNG